MNYISGYSKKYLPPAVIAAAVVHHATQAGFVHVGTLGFGSLLAVASTATIAGVIFYRHVLESKLMNRYFRSVESIKNSIGKKHSIRHEFTLHVKKITSLMLTYSAIGAAALKTSATSAPLLLSAPAALLGAGTFYISYVMLGKFMRPYA